MAISIAQRDFRIRTDATAAQGGAPVWAAGQNLSANVPSNTPFRIRFAAYNSGTTADAANNHYFLWVAINGGAYTSLSSPPPDISFVDATSGASGDGQLLTTSLLTGTGTFQGAGRYTFSSYDQGGLNLNASSRMEMEWGLQFNSPACDGNTYTFQIRSNNLTSWAATPSFTQPNHAALAAAEANDVLTAAGKVPNFAHLTATEANDSMTGGTYITMPAALSATEADDVLTGLVIAPLTATLVVFEVSDAMVGVALGGLNATLSANEAADVITGAGVVAALGSVTGHLSITEANDALVGLGTVAGIVGALNAFEASDILVGFASAPQGAILNLIEDNDIVASKTMLAVNQWVPVPPPSGVWTEAQGCG